MSSCAVLCARTVFVLILSTIAGPMRIRYFSGPPLAPAPSMYARCAALGLLSAGACRGLFGGRPLVVSLYAPAGRRVRLGLCGPPFTLPFTPFPKFCAACCPVSRMGSCALPPLLGAVRCVRPLLALLLLVARVLLLLLAASSSALRRGFFFSCWQPAISSAAAAGCSCAASPCCRCVPPICSAPPVACALALVPSLRVVVALVSPVSCLGRFCCATPFCCCSSALLLPCAGCALASSCALTVPSRSCR